LGEQQRRQQLPSTNRCRGCTADRAAGDAPPWGLELEMQAVAPKGCAAQEFPAAPAVGVAARGGGQARTAALCIKRMQLSL